MGGLAGWVKEKGRFSMLVEQLKKLFMGARFYHEKGKKRTKFSGGEKRQEEWHRRPAITKNRKNETGMKGVLGGEKSYAYF